MKPFRSISGGEGEPLEELGSLSPDTGLVQLYPLGGGQLTLISIVAGDGDCYLYIGNNDPITVKAGSYLNMGAEVFGNTGPYYVPAGQDPMCDSFPGDQPVGIAILGNPAADPATVPSEWLVTWVYSSGNIR